MSDKRELILGERNEPDARTWEHKADAFEIAAQDIQDERHWR